jgi:O-antigen ligase
MTKKKRLENRSSTGGEGGNWLGLIVLPLLVLPILSLTPNNFVPPALSYLGMATQELVVGGYLVLVLALAVVMGWVRRGGQIDVKRGMIWLLGGLSLFILWQVVTLGWAPAPYEGARLVGLWFLFAVFLGLGMASMEERAGIWLYRLMTGLGMVLAGTLLFERYTYGTDLLGFFFNHGMAAELLITILPLQLFVLFHKERSGDLWLTLIGVLLTVGAILAGLRRGVLLALAVTLVLITVAHLARIVRLPHASRLAILYGCLLLGAIAVGIGARDYVRERIEGAINVTSTEGGASTRIRNWKTALEMIRERPLLGVGQGGFPSHYGFYRAGWIALPENATLARAVGAEDSDEIRSPLTHNEYLQILTELGGIGLLLFFLFWGGLVWQLWRRFRAGAGYWPIGAMLGLVAFGISSLTSGFSFRYPTGMIWVWAIVVLGWVGSVSPPEKVGADDEELARDRLRIPGWARLVVPLVLLIPAILFAQRSWSVYQSQQLQGQATLGTEPLDLAYYPNNEAGNEGLVRRYQRVLEFDPHNSGAHLGYALLLFQMKRNREALAHAEFALRHGYSRPFGFVLLAYLKEQVTDLPGAIETLEASAAAYPRSFFVRASLVEMLRLAGQEAKMRRHQEEMYAIDQRQMESWELTMRASWKAAGEEATRRDLIPIDSLEPRLARTLVLMRAYHYHP